MMVLPGCPSGALHVSFLRGKGVGQPSGLRPGEEGSEAWLSPRLNDVWTATCPEAPFLLLHSGGDIQETAESAHHMPVGM